MGDLWRTEPSLARWIRELRDVMARHGVHRSVIEVGACRSHPDHDARVAFPGIPYVGVDAREGPGADEVGLAFEVLPRLEPAGLVLSVSHIEHDPTWHRTIMEMVAACHPDGGIFALSGPLDPWAAHELEQTPQPGYYGNRSAHEILDALAEGCRRYQRTIRKMEMRTLARHAVPRWPRLVLWASLETK